MTTPVNGPSDFLVVPDRQMEAFMQIWTARDHYNASISTDLIPSGTPVRIISGPMAGLTGTHLRHLKPRLSPTAPSSRATVNYSTPQNYCKIKDGINTEDHQAASKLHLFQINLNNGRQQ